MYKPPQIDPSTTNIAFIGSDEDKQARFGASEKEPAWKTAGQKEGVEVWRIVDFKVTTVPETEYGKFFTGDSYIILHTHKIGNELSFDLHFWLGAETSEDEAGTAAYKTVELDDHLHGKPVQHREVQHYESQQFLSYWTGGIRYLAGGAKSGFHHVERTQDKPRLFLVHGSIKSVRVVEVPLNASSLSSSDVFLLEVGEDVYQWIGGSASPGERAKAAEVATNLGYDVQVVEESDTTSDASVKFFQTIGGAPDSIPPTSSFQAPAPREEKKLVRVVTKGGGKYSLEDVASGSFSRSQLTPNDVYLVDIGSRVIVWVGKGAPPQEKKYALFYAQEYLTTNNLPPYISLTRVTEGAEPKEFTHLFSN